MEVDIESDDQEEMEVDRKNQYANQDDDDDDDDYDKEESILAKEQAIKDRAEALRRSKLDAMKSGRDQDQAGPAPDTTINRPRKRSHSPDDERPSKRR